ncbi:hypothetical protein [Baekduia soli]|nr:hypothetical protein [Baekduia soli]
MLVPRALDDPALSDEILADVREAVKSDYARAGHPDTRTPT